VDIGVHQDGLVHVSEMSDKFVKNPAEIVKVGQIVKVTVVDVNEGLKRISLSMRNPKNLGAKKLVEEFKTEKKNSLDDLRNRFK
jgi:uncharacterized protein